MDTATATQEPAEQTVEFGGLVWEKSDRKTEGIQYEATQPEVGEFRIYQYPKDNPYTPERWGAWAKFTLLLPSGEKPNVLKLEADYMVDTRDAAMCACINALDEWVNDMQAVLCKILPGDLYAQGFIAGQKDIKAKVAEVVL